MAQQADPVTWFELPADDTTRAGQFYAQVFGWNMSDMGGGSLYAQTAPSDDNMIPHEPGVLNGDISPKSEGFDRPHIVITVQDIDEKIKMVEDAGGQIVLPKTEISEMNMLWSIVSDTEGNRVGIIQNLT